MTFLALLTLAVTLLGPLGEQLALAGNEPQAPPAEEAEQAEDPVDPIEPTQSAEQPTEAPEDGGEEPAGLATEVPTEAAAPETYTLTINVFRCNHPEFDTDLSSNLQLVIDTCTGPGYGTFNLETTLQLPQQAGQVIAVEIGPGLAIQEIIPAGYDNPIADCFLYGPDGAQVDRIGPGTTSGGAWKVGSVFGDVTCNWYQVDRGLGTVYVVNMACPSTAGLFPEPSYDELVAMCTEPAGQKQFFVVHGAGLERMVPSGGEFNDALFEAIQTGPIEIWMDDPAGFERARVFCQVFGTDQITQVAPFSEVSVGGFRATGLTLVAGQRIHCSWFNIQEGPGFEIPDEDLPPLSTAPAQTPVPQPSELRIVKHTCPANFDLDDPESDPMTDCPEGPDGVTFTLTDDQDDTDDLQSATGGSAPNTVVFSGIPGGNYTISETVPANVGAIFVLGCGGGGGIDPIPQVIDGTLDTSIAQGVILTCHWFNVRGSGQNITDPDSSPTSNVADPESSPVARIAALEGTSGITIAKYACPAGFDVTTVDANPTAACTPLGGIGFDIDDEIDDGAGWYIETDGTGVGSVTGLPAGRYTIEEGVPNGTTATFIWDCYAAGGASNLTDPVMIGSVIQLDLPDDYQVHCDWYNVTGGTGRVIINKHACGILIPAYTLTYEQLRTQCTDDFAPIDFTVVSGTHQETQPASQDPLVLASFANVPSGYAAVVEDLPDGWAIPLVFCQVYTENGEPVGDLMTMDVLVGRQVSFQLDPGHVVSCDWFNVIQGFIDVHVTKYACPATVDAYGADLADLVVQCTDDPGSVDFTVEDGGLYLQTRAATGATPASFTDVPSGELRINEHMPDGYGVPAVWCRVDLETGGNLIPAQPATVTNGSNSGQLSIYHDVSAGQVLYCEWFNVAGDPGMVSIWKEACPEDFDAANATRQQLEQSCNEDIPDVDFTVTAGSFNETATSTNLFRYADFYAVPAGTLTVTEMKPAEYDTPVVWCRVQGTEGTSSPVKVEVIDGTTISWDLGPDEWLICEWYNAHDTGNTVHINKFDCPEGTTDDHDQNWYIDNCTTPHDGIEFRLTDILGARAATTAAGQVEFTGIPVGFFAVQETIPEDYVDPVVFCGVVSSAGGPLDAVAKQVDAGGGYLEGQLDYPSTYYLCYWYNIPGGPGEIIIEKYACPEGYDLYAHGADPEQDCPDPATGVTFTLGGPATELSDTTGGDGRATFGGLDPGAYTITEDVPEGTAFVFVLDCYGQRMGELRPYPLATGPELEIAVSAGETIICRWYNVPREDDGRLTVIKYTCTTEEYESDVDCEIEEDGVTFDLVWWNGNDWEYAQTGDTDGVGRLTFGPLEAGEYWLDEQDQEFCHLASEQLSDDGNWLNVADGEETVVHVYNCGAEPGQPGKVPMKYPNTGVAPIPADPNRATP